ncbi:MAG: sigma-70 family RNA polymerase sigma factor, partial [Planctomycetes bacterium]|nr:sigma-70 family RNA polymerase sigma factor [Planctomycetota bacterium]
MTTSPDSNATRDQLLAQGRSLRTLARSILRSDDGADDIVQEAFAAALDRAPSSGASPGWLAGVVKNLARRHLRDRTNRRRHESAVPTAPPAPPTDDVVASMQLHRELIDAVASLADPYRTAIVLRFWHELPPRAIARRQSIPVATVKTHLQRGIAMLQSRLDRRLGDRRGWLLALVPIAHPNGSSAVACGTPFAVAIAILTMNSKLPLVAACVLACACLSVWAAWSFDPSSESDAAERRWVAVRADFTGEPGESPGSRTPIAGPEDSSVSIGRSQVESREPTCAVTGRIVDAMSGASIPSARLRLVNFAPSERHPDRSALADDDGCFRLEVPLARSMDWVSYHFALADAPERATTEIRLDSDVQASIRDGVLDLGTIELVRGASVTGRVFEQDGSPLRSRAQLIVWDPSRVGSGVSIREARTLGFTGANGEIDLDERLAPIESGVVMLAAIAEHSIGWTRLGLAPGQEYLPPVEITLQPIGAATVRVIDNAGRPISGAAVTAVPHFLPIGLAPMWPAKHARSTMPHSPSINALFRRTTDGDGCAELAGLPLPVAPSVRDDNRQQHLGEAYVFTAWAKGYLANEVTATPLVGRSARAEIVLTVEREVTLHGRVMTPDGAAVAGVEIRGNGVPVS